MKSGSFALAIVMSLAVSIAACQKKVEDTPVADTADGSQPTAQAPVAQAAPAEPTQADLERATKQAALDYATMEDTYLNDPKGQWAQEASASSVFGESESSSTEGTQPKNITGKPDGRHWTNNHQDMGFDHFEATFQKPVHATEVRVVFANGAAAANKVEVKGADGAYVTVWSGLNEDPADQRGPRHWFVRKFDRTAKPVQAVKVTLANTVHRGYKDVDAVQLIGE